MATKQSLAGRLCAGDEYIDICIVLGSNEITKVSKHGTFGFMHAHLPPPTSNQCLNRHLWKHTSQLIIFWSNCSL